MLNSAVMLQIGMQTFVSIVTCSLLFQVHVNLTNVTVNNLHRLALNDGFKNSSGSYLRTALPEHL